MTAGFGAGIARTSGAKSRATRAMRAMRLERPVRRRERRTVKTAIENAAAERLSLRLHQRRYAALPTALRCIACPQGLYEGGSMGAS